MPSSASLTTKNATSSRLYRRIIVHPRRRGERLGDAATCGNLASRGMPSPPRRTRSAWRADRGRRRSAARRARRASGVGEAPRPTASAHEHAGYAVDHALERASLAQARPPGGRRPALRPAPCRSPLRRASAPRGSAGTAADRPRRSASPGTRRRPAGHRAQPRFLGPVADDRQRRRRPLRTRGSPRRAACRAPARTRPGSRLGTPGGVGLVKVCIDRGIHDGRPRDYSIGGFCPQHNENSPHSGPRGRAVARSQRASRARTGRSSRGSRPARPAPARNRRRTDPTRSASASGSSRCAGRARAPRPTSRRSGSC